MLHPVNRYIHINVVEKPPSHTHSTIVLPEDFQPIEDKYIEAQVLSWATDVRFENDLEKGSRIIVDKSMIEEISVNNEKINIVLDNYVVGIIK